jgi:MFS family permease
MFFRAVPPAARRAFWLDAVSGLIVGVFNGGTLPFIPVIARQQLGASPFLISLIAAAPFAGYLTMPFWVRSAETGRKVRQVVVFNVLARALIGFLFFVHRAPGFVTLVILSQFIPGFCFAAYTGLIKAIYPDAWRGRLTSLVRVGITFTSLAAASAVGLLLARFAFNYVFPVLALIGVGGTLLFGLIAEPEQQVPPSPPSPPLAIFSLLREDKLFARFTLAFFTFGFGVIMCSPVITLLQVDKLHITPQWVGMLAAVATVFAAGFYYFWGRVVDTRGPIFCALAAIAGWVLVFIGYTFAANLYWLIPIAVVSGIASSANDLAVINGVMQFGKGEAVARYSGVHYTLLGIRGLTGPLLGGLLVEIMSLQAIFALATGLIVLGFFFMLSVLRAQPRREEIAR